MEFYRRLSQLVIYALVSSTQINMYLRSVPVNENNLERRELGGREVGEAGATWVRENRRGSGTARCLPPSIRAPMNPLKAGTPAQGHCTHGPTVLAKAA